MSKKINGDGNIISILLFKSDWKGLGFSVTYLNKLIQIIKLLINFENN